MKRFLAKWDVHMICGLQMALGLWCLTFDPALGLYIIVLSFFPIAVAGARKRGYLHGWAEARMDTIALMAVATKNDWSTAQLLDAINTTDREMTRAHMSKREFNRLDNAVDQMRAQSDGSHDAL